MICFRGPVQLIRSSAMGWTTARVPTRKRQAGCPHQPCGRRGRGETPCRSARPYRGEEQDDRRALGPDETRCDDACLLVARMERSAIRGSCRGVSPLIALRSIRATKKARARRSSKSEAGGCLTIEEVVVPAKLTGRAKRGVLAPSRDPYAVSPAS
jgi:hypothetical protein